MNIYLLILGIGIGILVIISFYGILFNEKDAYNHGICPICGGTLKPYKKDKNGRKHFICDTCKKYTCSVRWFRI